MHFEKYIEMESEHMMIPLCNLQQYDDDGDANDDWIVVEERRRRPELENRKLLPPENASEIEVCTNSTFRNIEIEKEKPL